MKTKLNYISPEGIIKCDKLKSLLCHCVDESQGWTAGDYIFLCVICGQVKNMQLFSAQKQIFPMCEKQVFSW